MEDAKKDLLAANEQTVETCEENTSCSVENQQECSSQEPLLDEEALDQAMQLEQLAIKAMEEELERALNRELADERQPGDRQSGERRQGFGKRMDGEQRAWQGRPRRPQQGFDRGGRGGERGGERSFRAPSRDGEGGGFERRGSFEGPRRSFGDAPRGQFGDRRRFDGDRPRFGQDRNFSQGGFSPRPPRPHFDRDGGMPSRDGEVRGERRPWDGQPRGPRPERPQFGRSGGGFRPGGDRPERRWNDGDRPQRSFDRPSGDRPTNSFFPKREGVGAGDGQRFESRERTGGFAPRSGGFQRRPFDRDNRSEGGSRFGAPRRDFAGGEERRGGFDGPRRSFNDAPRPRRSFDDGGRFDRGGRGGSSNGGFRSNDRGGFKPRRADSQDRGGVARVDSESDLS